MNTKDRSRLALNKYPDMPSGKTLGVIGGGLAVLIAFLLIAGLADPLGIFGNGKLGLKVVAMNVDVAAEEQTLDEDGNISDEVREVMYTKINEYAAAEDRDERLTNVHSYYKALIDDALNNGNTEFAMIILFQEYDYLVGMGEEETALEALMDFDTGRVEERHRNNVYRMISETAERLGKNDIAEEYRGKMTEA